MDEPLWNKKQEETFELYFKKLSEEAIKVSDILNLIEGYSQKWQQLYEVLRNSSDFDYHDRIIDQKVININNQNYLFFQVGLWHYFVIDLKNEKSLSNEECLTLFDESLFVQNFGEKQTNKYESFYYFSSLSQEVVKDLINLYVENQDIYNAKNYFIYKPINNTEINTSLSIRLDNKKIILSFFDKERKHLNYIFLNNNLTPIGASNPTNNLESLKIMANRIKNIEIPKSLIPSYLISNNEKTTLRKKRQNENNFSKYLKI